MEEEREKMRQGFRDKYGIKKKEEKEEEARKQQEALMGGPATADSTLNRAKKTQEELAAEANQDEFTSKYTFLFLDFFSVLKNFLNSAFSTVSLSFIKFLRLLDYRLYSIE